ncbi:GDP-mannose 4,6-dehydratase [Hazenella coriacea]|uniref:UDP-glucuronate 4-epimerase n=1 Tax=Hazenella coriacea TaxID=1179467 RepID=A0A4R3L7W3_9BACL|nr:GDP-mannose 4,6-dehydratase [Hazenella coriacea]TCS94314.1 UDP-glucuronate 4-epimerase [Hazenella coriacea]
MNVIVTGGAGFIGATLVNRLRKESQVDQIAVIDNLDPYYDPSLKRSRIKGWEHDPKVTWFEADICDEASLRPIFASNEWDCVLHLAAIPGVRSSLIDPVHYVEVDVKGTVQLLHLTGQRKIPHFIFLSSSSVYGEQPQGVALREEMMKETPESPYAAAKWAAEGFCRTFHQLYGFHCTTLRPFTVYGPGQRPDMAIRKFADLMWAGEKLPLFQPESTRDYTYVEDMVEAIWLAMNQGTGYQVYNVGSGHPISLLDMVQRLAKQLHISPEIEICGAQQGDVSHTWADLSKVNTELGYAPAMTFEQGIERFVDWFKIQKRGV